MWRNVHSDQPLALGNGVAFFAAASTLPAGFAAADGCPGIAPVHVTETFEIDPAISMEQPGSAPFVHTRALDADVEAAQAAVRQAREAADVVIFSIHWGVPAFWRSPFQGDLAEYQQPLGRALVDAGADLVVGHHSHSLHGIETYRGKPIVYSLGNFVFHMPLQTDESPWLFRLPYRMDGLQDESWKASMILLLELDETVKAAYEIWPLSLDAAGNPHLLEGDAGRALPSSHSRSVAGSCSPRGGDGWWCDPRPPWRLQVARTPDGFTVPHRLTAPMSDTRNGAVCGQQVTGADRGRLVAACSRFAWWKTAAPAGVLSMTCRLG